MTVIGEESFKFKKVMLVEDAAIDRYVARKLFHRNSFSKESVIVNNAMEALDYLKGIKAQSEVPQIIFLDISMPGMDGFDFLEKYKLLPDMITTNCSIAILTSSIDPKDISRATDNPHVCCFINKPLTIDKIDNFQTICNCPT